MILALGASPLGGYHVYCTHCKERYYGEIAGVYHPTYPEIGKFASVLSVRINADPGFTQTLKTCPHAGQTFRAPEAIRMFREGQ